MGICVKAAKFDYIRAESIEDAVAALDKGDGEAIIIAGGQTLMPMLSMRLARPELVVDINAVAELAGIEVRDDAVVIGACTRQVAVLNSPEIAEHLPLLKQAVAHVGHFQTRNRGTVGGSLAHADPAAEIPLAALALDAAVELRSVSGTRRVAMADYFIGPMMTAREADELLVAVHFPRRPASGGRGTSFHEVSERHGDFAVVAVAALIDLDTGGACRHAAVAFGGVDDCPVRVAALEAALVGRPLDSATLGPALDLIDAAIQPGSDQHASADYRRRVARALAERTITEAGMEARAAA